MKLSKIQIGKLIDLIFIVWFLYSLYSVFVDPTLSTQTRISGEIINCLSLFLCIDIYKNGYNKATFALYALTFLILAWYLYYTPIDLHNAGYTIFWKILFVLVDVSFILYLLGTLLFFFLNRPANTSEYLNTATN